ncbi:hypothetical protein [Chitinophaga sp. CF418]|uniref:HYR-like domain-containing protein n=1 Tax=Chitinophaga sp. CF418 TaxID=1855287 RepID=UPI000923F6B9|nr:hypothetical protein [Chitinophaga sp. CF418]SHN46112.1 hypothetical protein SAMN05216311_1233 [Chitinophaga sp. CF418]
MHAVRLLLCILRAILQTPRARIALALPLLLFLQQTTYAQSANLDQGANEKASAPVSPVDWINGNLNAQQAHFLEGYSVPYRAILQDLVVDQVYTLVIGFDLRDGGKQALDYITHFQRLEPHNAFGHAAETVDPLLNISGFPPSYFTTTDVYAIPTPSAAGSPVPGQPVTSFTALPGGEKLFTGYNVDITDISYASQGSLTAAHSETVVNITFKALKATAVLAWGGHIASIVDWGKDSSASAISGSPYHMRLKNWIIDGAVVSIGNQDRSLKTDAVFIPPKCEVTGPVNACVETTKLTYVATVDDPTGLTYAWSIIGPNTANAKIVDPTLGTIDVVPIGATFTAGSFSLQLIVTREGLTDTCYLNSHTNPGAPVIISQVIANAGSDQTITNLDVAHLSASATGGDGTYTFTWTPTTGLSDPNIANPDFTPPSTGVFEFVVKADDGQCSDLDTVVITVTEHPKAPCGIDGPSPVCPGSQNQYTGPDPSLVGSYLWSVTGDGTINGVNNIQKVLIDAANHCGAYQLRLIVSTPDGKRKDTCYLDVLIKDTIKPVVSGDVADKNVACAKDVPAAPTVGVTDNCTAELKIETSRDVVDSTCVNKFKIIRKWWATDLCGNTSDTLKQVITVNDDVKPVITADFDKTVNVECLKDIPAPPKPTATDNCGGSIEPVYTEIGSGTKCDSTITRKWVFTDACGNSDSVTQVINIKDDIKPVRSNSKADTTVTCAKDIPAIATVTATDNCDPNPTVYFKQKVVDSTCVNRFKVIRKWWAKDACGNTSDTITQVITVYDDVKPVITADFDKTVNVQCLKDIPAVPKPTATDNCNGDVTPVYSEKGSGTACDSTINRKWVFTDACGNSDSVTQVINIKDDIKPVLSGTADNINVKCAKDIPAAANITATDNCDLKPTVYFKQKVTDSTCVNRFKVTRKWWAVDACGNKSDTLTQLITVYDDVKPVITANFDKTVNIQCPKDIPAVPTPTATDNCNGNIQPVYSEKGSGTACDSTINRKWVFTDACGNSDSVTQVIYIKDNTAPVVVYKPANKIISCTSPVVFDTPTFSDNCGSVSTTYEDRKEGTACPFKYFRKWTAKDKCNNSVTFEQTITVACCAQCGYTQGFYGNPNGRACTPSGTTMTAKQIMSAAVDAQPGDSVIFGLKSTGKFFTLFLGDITNDNIFKMLPGGGTPLALKGYATFSKTNTWGNVPLLTNASNYGKINNILLSQTMSMFFNLYLTPTLKDLQLKGDTLLTVKPIACGSNTLNQTIQKFVIPPSVLNYLISVGKANVAGLYELANMYLGGQTVPGVTIGDVSKAVDAINRAFDGCAAVVGWSSSSSVNTAKVSSVTTVAPATDPKVAAQANETTLNVTVFPNPYNDKVIFRFVAPTTGQVKLEVYNVLGQQIGQLNYGMVDKGTQHTIEYHVPSPYRDVLLYRLNVGEHFRTGKVIPAKK